MSIEPNALRFIQDEEHALSAKEKEPQVAVRPWVEDGPTIQPTAKQAKHVVAAVTN